MATSFYKWLKGFSFLWIFLMISGFSSGRVSPMENNWMHPFFVSVSEFEYNANTQSLEISCKIFTDDFEKALRKRFGGAIDIYNTKDKRVLEQQMAGYLKSQLILRVDGKLLSLDYIGYEIESQSTFCYFEAHEIKKTPVKMEIFNKIFHELYTNQISILHVTVGGVRKSTKLDYPSAEAIFNF